LTCLWVRGRKQCFRSTREHPYLVTLLERQASRKSPDTGRLLPVRTDWVQAGNIVPLGKKGEVRAALRLHVEQPMVTVREGDRIDLLEYLDDGTDVLVEGKSLRLRRTNVGSQVPRKIVASLSLARLVGLYLAEGCPREPGALAWYLGYHEMDLAVEICATLKEHFGVEAHIARRPAGNIFVTLNHTLIKRLFLSLGGHLAGRKRIHPRIMGWSPRLLEGVWDGCMAGDGYSRRRRTGPEETIVTVSETLARQLWKIGLWIGKQPTLSYTDPKLSHGVQTRQRRWDVRTFGSGPNARKAHEGHLLANVQRIGSEPYAGLVYNLEVEEDHSYVADGAVVHNCVGFSERGDLECTPIPVPRGTGPDGMTIYNEAQKRDGWPLPHDGTSVVAGAQYLKSIGYWSAYVWANTIEDVIKWVLLKGPVIIGSVWTNTMFTPDSRFVLHPSGTVAGGHAWLVYGYDQVSGYFLMQNSWGSGWSNRGRAWIFVQDLKSLVFDRGGEACAPTEPGQLTTDTMNVGWFGNKARIDADGGTTQEIGTGSA
jgi:hypothetical protein